MKSIIALLILAYFSIAYIGSLQPKTFKDFRAKNTCVTEWVKRDQPNIVEIDSPCGLVYEYEAGEKTTKWLCDDGNTYFTWGDEK